MVVFTQMVHNEMCARPAVEDVAQNVQTLHRQTLNDIAYSHDKMVGAPGFDDGTDDGFVVGMLVRIVNALVEQLLYNIGILFWQTLSHLRTRIFQGEIPTDEHEIVERAVIKLIVKLRLLVQKFELLLRIIDERAEFMLLLLRQWFHPFRS